MIRIVLEFMSIAFGAIRNSLHSNMKIEWIQSPRRSNSAQWNNLKGLTYRTLETICYLVSLDIISS